MFPHSPVFVRNAHDSRIHKVNYVVISLDRDSGHWIRDNPDEIERRRKLFWEVYAYGMFLYKYWYQWHFKHFNHNSRCMDC